MAERLSASLPVRQRPISVVWPLALAALCFVGYASLERRLDARRLEAELEEYSRLLREPCWDINARATRSCLEVMSASGRYRNLRVTLSDGTVLGEVAPPPSQGWGARLGLVRRTPHAVSVSRDGEVIARLEVERLDPRLLRHGLALAGLLALALMVWQRLRLAQLARATQVRQASANKAIRQLARQLRSVVSSAPIILFSVDHDGRFSMLEGRGLLALDLREGSLNGEPYEVAVAGLPVRPEQIAQALAGEAHSEIVPFRDRVYETWCAPLASMPDATARVMAPSLADELLAAGEEEQVGVIGVCNDITELERARQQATRANEAKSRFLAAMSHELRTPLNGVLGYAQILDADARLSGDQRRNVDAIARCGRHLLMLIEDVLDLVKAETDRVEVNASPIDLRVLIDEVMTVIRRRAESKSLDCSVSLAADVPDAIRADATKLRQILINLLGNAVKFTARGGVELTVARRDPDRIRFSVRDSGPGMSEEELARIFTAFSQASAGRQLGGTGLGLTISRQLAEAMRGSVSVESEPGVGSTFHLELPCDEVGLEAVTPRPDQAFTGGDFRLAAGQSLTVVVADDIAINRELILHALGAVGVRVLQASNGLEALDLLEANPDVGLVILDLRMPELDGEQTVHRLRAAPATSGLPVLAMSASASADVVDGLGRAGFDDFLPKPFALPDLYRTISRLTGVRFERRSTTEVLKQPPTGFDPEQRELLVGLREAARVGDLGQLMDLSQQLGPLAGSLGLAPLIDGLQFDRLEDRLDELLIDEPQP